MEGATKISFFEYDSCFQNHKRGWTITDTLTRNFQLHFDIYITTTSSTTSYNTMHAQKSTRQLTFWLQTVTPNKSDGETIWSEIFCNYSLNFVVTWCDYMLNALLFCAEESQQRYLSWLFVRRLTNRAIASAGTTRFDSPRGGLFTPHSTRELI